jgi:hypothetical protein
MLGLGQHTSLGNVVGLGNTLYLVMLLVYVGRNVVGLCWALSNTLHWVMLLGNTLYWVMLLVYVGP